MYSITLEVNQICNFSCDYCYLGKLSSKRMDFVTAYQAMEIAFLNAQRHADRMVWIDFVGGETLLSYVIGRFKMQDLEVRLEKYAFYRCHNGVIVNLDYVDYVQEFMIVLVSGEKIYTTKSRKKELIKKLAERTGSA